MFVKIKLVLFLARHAVVQHNKLIQQLSLFFSLKYPHVVFQMMEHGPLFSILTVYISEGQTIFLPLSFVKLQPG
jgi:hypothetical protein